MRDVFVVLLWQLVLVGGWVVSRRLRRLERLAMPPWYAQVGALRETVLDLQEAGVFYARRQGRRLQEIELLTAQLANEVRMLAKQIEELSHAVAELSSRAGGRGRRRPSAPPGESRAEGTIA